MPFQSQLQSFVEPPFYRIKPQKQLLSTADYNMKRSSDDWIALATTIPHRDDLQGLLDGKETQHIPGIISFSDKRCDHFTVHQCELYTAFSERLCAPCAANEAKGKSCS